MKSYFCQKCGREYKLSECLRNGYSMFCFDCPTTRVRITGFAYILIGIFLGLIFFIIRYLTKVDSSGAGYLFLPASLGLIVVGFLRIYQQRLRWQKTLKARKAAEEAKKNEDEKDDESGE